KCAQRLTQVSQRKDGAAGEGVQGIQNDDLNIAGQTLVLKAVVQKEVVGGKKLLHHLPGLPAVGANSEMRVTGTQQDLGFVASHIDGNQVARLHDDALIDG